MSSRDAWLYCNKQLAVKDETISRASVINFLNAMVDDGIFGYTEITGKGGHRRLYTSLYNGPRMESLVRQMVARTLEQTFVGSWWQ